MRLEKIFAAAVIAFFSMSVAYAAGGPMNEDLSQILALTQGAIAAGKQGNVEQLKEGSEAALKQAKSQVELRSSVSLERIIPRLKKAVREAESGNIAASTEALESAMTDMGKKPPPKFGGGSE